MNIYSVTQKTLLTITEFLLVSAKHDSQLDVLLCLIQCLYFISVSNLLLPEDIDVFSELLIFGHMPAQPIQACILLQFQSLKSEFRLF